ncbi:WAT1-related protein At1g68170-like [Henckelia pumila]|uniref:WAT1-related protein At1g68170-like n=1 Tax=Henckelia pumila TaxID=405737 RepID=UPI003C6E9569
MILLVGSIQAVAYALSTEKDWSQWKLGWNLRLLNVAYMGIVGSGIMSVLVMSCLKMREPLFVSVFNPLLLVLVAISSSLFLDEKLHLGCVLGAAVIICGLYCVLRDKSKEIKVVCRLTPSSEEQIVEGDIDCNGGGIKSVAPNFVPTTEIMQVSDKDTDLEAV